MSIQKKSLINTLKSAKKANVVKEEVTASSATASPRQAVYFRYTRCDDRDIDQFDLAKEGFAGVDIAKVKRPVRRAAEETLTAERGATQQSRFDNTPPSPSSIPRTPCRRQESMQWTQQA